MKKIFFIPGHLIILAFLFIFSFQEKQAAAAYPYDSCTDPFTACVFLNSNGASISPTQYCIFNSSSLSGAHDCYSTEYSPGMCVDTCIGYVVHYGDWLSSYACSSIPSVSYTCQANGGYCQFTDGFESSATLWSATYYCGAVTPAPSGVDVKTTVWNSGTRTTAFASQLNSNGPVWVYSQAPYQISWGAVTDATSCTLNGTSVSVSGGSINTYTYPLGVSSVTYTLSCTGSGGTTSDSVTLRLPPPPTNLTMSCSPSGTSATFSWTAPGGYTTFYTRARNDTTGTDLTTSTAWDEAFVGTSKSFGTTVNNTYHSWVFTREPTTSAWSDNAISNTVTCNDQSPNLTVSVWNVFAGDDGYTTPWYYPTRYDGNVEVYLGANYTIYWNAVPGATSCTLNGSAVSTAGGNMRFPNISASTTYTYRCVDSLGNPYTDVLNVNIPPKPSNLTATCSGTTISTSWTLPLGYNNTYWRADPILGAWPPQFLDDNATTTKSFTGVLGQTYSVWVHAKNSVNGAWGDNVNATVVCPNAPTISLSPASFSFSGTSGSVAPAAQTLTVNNSGVNPSNLLYRAQTNQTWCRVNGINSTGSITGGPLASGASTNISVTVDALSNAGTLTCTITVSNNGSSPAASNSPQTRTVTYTIKPSNVSNVTASNATCGRINLSWTTANSGTTAKTYTIYRSTTNNSATAAVIASGISTTTYSDTTAVVGTNYYYWVETSSGGQVSPNRTAASGTPISPVACITTPNPPTTPSRAYNQNTDPVIGRTACGQITVVWTDASTNETGFKVLQDSVQIGSTQNPSVPSTATGGSFNYTFSAGDTVPHGYSVIATNTGVDSSATSASDNPVAAVACTASLDSSDKDVVALNGVNLYSSLPFGNICTGTDAIPAGKTFTLGDTVKFSINLCNTGSGPASSITVTDSLINLKMPDSGWNAQYCTGTCSAITPTVSGTSPNQTLTFILPASIAAGGTPSLTFEATLAVPSGFSGAIARFQNSFNASYNNGAGVVNLFSPKFTPLYQFYTGTGVPTFKEAP